VLDATHNDSASLESDLEIERVDLQRQLVLSYTDMPAVRSDALRRGRHPFYDGVEGLMLDDTSPLESANRRGSTLDAGDGGTHSLRAVAPRRAPALPAVTRKDNILSTGESLKRELKAYRTLPSLKSRTAVVLVPLSRHCAAASACQSQYCEAIDASRPASIIAIVHHDPPPGIVSLTYGSSPAEAPDRGYGSP
jgi:hypothetical protein